MDILGFDQAEFEEIVEREKREAVEMATAEGYLEGYADINKQLMKGLLAKAVRAVRECGLDPETASDLFGVDVHVLCDVIFYRTDINGHPR